MSANTSVTVPLAAATEPDSSCFQSSSAACRHFSKQFSTTHWTECKQHGSEVDGV